MARRVHAVEEHFALEDGEIRGVKCTPGRTGAGDAGELMCAGGRTITYPQAAMVSSVEAVES